MVAAAAFARLETRLGRTRCRVWRRRTGCYADCLDAGHDEEGSAEGKTDSRGQKIAELVDCARAAVEAAIGQRALCL